MHIIVLGSGIIGTTTAYYLALSGHKVTVIDRQAGAGLETSYANAGQISPGYSAPWAAPGIPLKAIKWLMSEFSPLVINPKPDWEKLRFITAMLRNCTGDRYAVNKDRMLRLAEYSRQAFIDLRKQTGIEYDQRSQGTLQLFRTRKQVSEAAKDINLLESCGIPFEQLGVEQCIEAEPALADVADKLSGGLRLPLDETGDCYKFTDGLMKKCARLGVNFRFGITIEKLEVNTQGIAGVVTDQGRLTADNYVVALGSYSPLLLRPIGIDLPVYPVKGYSLTIPVTAPQKAPQSTVMDETYKVAVTRLGDRIRVAGTAELAGYSMDLKEQRRGTVTHVVRDLFPRGGDIDAAEFWTGLRPMTPDGTPIVGKTRYSNLFLNTGHGTLGWTMSCGSGRLLADMIDHKQPELDIEGLGMDRYQATGYRARQRYSNTIYAN